MSIQVAMTGAHLAIDPESGPALVASALEGFNGAIARGVSLEHARAAELAARERVAAVSPSGVMVIPVEGVLLPKAPAWAAEYGIGSTSAIRAAVNAAARDKSVTAIVLAVDSPGGDVRGVEEAAEAVAAAAAVKPVIAVVEYMAASAAYWLASQAREIVIPASGLAGSIGVITTRLDATAMLAREGLKFHVLTAGPHKAEGHPATEMSESEEAATKARLEGLYTAFVGGVARGRRVAIADVETRFGGGRTFYGRDAVTRGLADRLGSMGDVLAGLRVADPTGDRGNADPFAERMAIEAELLSIRALAGV